MGGVIVNVTPSSGVERLLGAAKHLGLEHLEAVVACTFTFDRTYFETFLEALGESHLEGAELLRGIPIDVVCDHRHYEGHGTGYNTRCWSDSNLFHPKLLMLCFVDRILWIEGSLNLTRAGHDRNRELATYHESERGTLPAGVLTLLERIAKQGVAAAKLVIAGVGRQRTDRRNRSVTSLTAPLLDDLLERVPKASHVVLVSPFFDQREQAGPTIEASALRRLSDAYPEASFRIYLPQVIGPDGEEALQGNRAVFAGSFGPRASADRVSFCAVPSSDHPLHAKLIAIRHRAHRAATTLLTGSPNITESALLSKGSRANVELARELQVNWRSVDKLLSTLGSKFKPMSACRFLPPAPMTSHGWHALESAKYDPIQSELTLVWLKPPESTILRYAGEPLSPDSAGSVAGFRIRGEELRLETLSRADPTRTSWCPIEIPVESRLALADLPEGDMPPEWWIAQLGALSATPNQGDKVNGAGWTPSSESPAVFSLAGQVRDLADRMRYGVEVLTDPLSPRPRINATLQLLEKIFQVHDPLGGTTVRDQTWRLWVRLEITQAVTEAASARQDDAAPIRRLKLDLRSRLSTMDVPPEVSGAWRNLTEALG